MIRSALAGAVALVLSTAWALAADWTERENVKFRLLAETTAIGGSGEALIGLEVALAPDWQFYHEAPGEFGVAPEFDWAASRNLAAASLHWPEPSRFLYSTDPLVTTLGYKDRLLLPVVLEAKSAGEDLKLRLDLTYAVCAEICLFDEVDLGLTLRAGSGEATRHGARLQEALADALAAAR